MKNEEIQKMLEWAKKCLFLYKDGDLAKAKSQFFSFFSYYEMNKTLFHNVILLLSPRERLEFIDLCVYLFKLLTFSDSLESLQKPLLLYIEEQVYCYQQNLCFEATDWNLKVQIRDLLLQYLGPLPSESHLVPLLKTLLFALKDHQGKNFHAAVKEFQESLLPVVDMSTINKLLDIISAQNQNNWFLLENSYFFLEKMLLKWYLSTKTDKPTNFRFLKESIANSDTLNPINVAKKQLLNAAEIFLVICLILLGWLLTAKTSVASLDGKFLTDHWQFDSLSTAPAVSLGLIGLQRKRQIKCFNTKTAVTSKTSDVDLDTLLYEVKQNIVYFIFKKTNGVWILQDESGATLASFGEKEITEEVLLGFKLREQICEYLLQSHSQIWSFFRNKVKGKMRNRPSFMKTWAENDTQDDEINDLIISLIRTLTPTQSGRLSSIGTVYSYSSRNSIEYLLDSLFVLVNEKFWNSFFAERGENFTEEEKSFIRKNIVYLFSVRGGEPTVRELLDYCHIFPKKVLRAFEWNYETATTILLPEELNVPVDTKVFDQAFFFSLLVTSKQETFFTLRTEKKDRFKDEYVSRLRMALENSLLNQKSKTGSKSDYAKIEAISFLQKELIFQKYEKTALRYFAFNLEPSFMEQSFI